MQSNSNLDTIRGLAGGTPGGSTTVASANSITPGNTTAQYITGTTTLKYIKLTDATGGTIPDGFVTTLIFAGILTIQNNAGSVPAGYKAILTPTGADLLTHAGEAIMLVYNATLAYWIVVDPYTTDGVATVASANTVTFGNTSSIYITGTTDVKYITTTGMANGQAFDIAAGGAFTFKHNSGSVPANTAPIIIPGGLDALMAAGDSVRIVYNSTLGYWMIEAVLPQIATFTPALTAAGSSWTYTTQYGSVIKIGRLVVVQFFIQVNVATLGANAALTINAPYTAQNVVGKRYAGSLKVDVLTTISGGFLQMEIRENEANFRISYFDGTTAQNASDRTKNGTEIQGTISYYVA